MNLKDALKSIAPAVGDGKLVPTHAYVLFDGDTALKAYNGQMWASVSIDQTGPAFVRHEALAAAMSREGAEIGLRDDFGLTVRAGRSRLQLKGVDPESFPTEPTGTPQWLESVPAGFKSALHDLRAFCGKADNHIWQMGVHFRIGYAFAANPFALIVKPGVWSLLPITMPPWATTFVLSQDDEPNMIADCGAHLKMLWNHRCGLTSSWLIEGPPDNVVSYAERIIADPVDGVPVPPNLRDAIQRVKSFGATSVRIGNGKIEHVTEQLEFEEEVDISSEPKVWGIDSLLDALTHAESINLRESPAKWEGGGYKGVFSGMSG